MLFAIQKTSELINDLST
jgi:hypothetical protein